VIAWLYGKARQLLEYVFEFSNVLFIPPLFATSFPPLSGRWADKKEKFRAVELRAGHGRKDL